MLFEFRLPDIGEGVAEGEVVAWHVEPGSYVREDQDMVEVMTDKATVTIGAPRAGRITQLAAKVGERVRVGSVLVVIDTAATTGATGVPEKRPSSRPPELDTARSRFQAPASRPPAKPPAGRWNDRNEGKSELREARSEAKLESKAATTLARTEGSAKSEGRAETTKAGVAASAVGDLRESLPGASFFSRSASANGHGSPVRDVHGAERAEARPELGGARDADRGDHEFFAEKPLATPATRKLARDLGVDLRNVPPSGPGGRVTKDDLRQFASEPSQEPAALEERTPFVGLRRRIAERMQLSKHKAAHFTFVEEVDVGALQALIERAKPAAERAGVKLHYLPFIVKAVTLALKKHPALNSTLDEHTNELVLRRYYHIGVATATDQGLVVPVVRDADRKSPLAIAREIQQLSEGARHGKLVSRELTGSTFTVTSLGRMGGLLATPVLNYPEVGILGVHRVKERPVVRDGQIVIGQVMLLSLSFDHRIIDGHVGAAFAYDVIAYLEQPELLLLELA